MDANPDCAGLSGSTLARIGAPPSEGKFWVAHSPAIALSYHQGLFYFRLHGHDGGALGSNGAPFAGYHRT